MILQKSIANEITYSDIVRHDNMPSEQYFSLKGYSRSFLKNEINGVSPYFEMSNKMAIGSLVDKILTDPDNVDVNDDNYMICRNIAIEIQKQFGTFIKRFKPQVSFTANMHFNGLTMSTQGRLDWLLENHAVIDLKITEATKLEPLVKFMGYEDQLWHYCKMANVKAGYIIAYSTKLKRCFPPLCIPCDSNYNEFWANGIKKFGNVI